MSGSTQSLRWRTLGAGADALGLEHVELKIAETGIAAEGVMIGGEGEAAHGLRWRITVDPDWTAFRSVHLTRLGGPTVALRHDGYGEWSDGEGKKRKEFSGLSDCLIEGSPFGLIALLKRLGKKADKAQTLDVVFLAVPSLEISRVGLDRLQGEAGRRVALSRGETTEEIVLDDAGLITAWGERIAALRPTEG